MTYHSLHLKIVSGSVAEKREAIRLLRDRNSRLASRLLILASEDSSAPVVLAAVIAMKAGPQELQVRYRDRYVKLTDFEDFRIRQLCVWKLTVFSDRNLADVFRKVAKSSVEGESLAACEALIMIGFVEEARNYFDSGSDNFVFKSLVIIGEHNFLNEDNVRTLERLRLNNFVPKPNTAYDVPFRSDPGTRIVSVAQLLQLAETQIKGRQRRLAFDDAVAKVAALSPHIGKHFRNLDGNERQVTRAMRHIENSEMLSFEALLCGTEHPEPVIRWRSMVLLIHLKDPRSIAAALQMLDDSNDDVRNIAVEAVGSFGLVETLPRLVETACDAEITMEAFNTALTALEAIVAMPGDRTDALLAVYRRGNREISPLATEHLAALKDSALIEEFEKMIWDSNELSAAQAINGIGAIGSSRCQEIVKLRLNDKRVRPRERARKWWYGVWANEKLDGGSPFEEREA